MPVYEFRCPSCQMEYEERVDRIGETAPCPKCGSLKVERLMSASAVHTRSSSGSSGSPCASGQCDWSPGPCCPGGSCGLD